MKDEIIRQKGPQSTIETLRSLMTEDGYDGLSIVKTAVKDGPKGLLARGISVLQRWNEVRFGQALLQELEDMRRAGKIREDFNTTDAGVFFITRILRDDRWQARRGALSRLLRPLYERQRAGCGFK